jgi:RHS repeat-associated protein
LKLNGTSKRKTIYGGAYEKTIESGISREFYYLDGNVIVVKQDGVFTPYLAFTDNLGSYLSVVDSLGSRVFFAIYDAWGKQSISTTGNKICLRRGYCGHEMLNEFNLINMNGRIYSPCIGRFLAPDNFVQAPDNTQSFNRYSYCLNNPLKYVDPDGNFWHIVIGAAVGGVLNLWGNWDNCDGFWQGFVAFCVGAGTGAAVAATGGAASAGLGSVIGVSALGGAGTAATNDIISQTGRNFSGFEDVNWKTTGKNALIGGVASSAGSAVGYWAASSSVVVNNINSPLLRSAVVSPLASGAGHVAGGTTYGLLEGNSLSTSFSQSFEGLGKDIAIGSAISLGTTMGGCFLHGVNPLNGEPIMVPNRGFSSVYGINEMTLEEGTVVDRYGYPTGEYVAPEGVPFEQRTLPRVKIKSPYYKYIVTKPIPGVQYGIAAPSFWLGAPGGGVQYQLPYSINDLIEAGYLQIIP